MIKIRHSEDRGHANHGWLDSRHTFSFADYYDPDYMSFSVLRVINEDCVAGGGGFATHGHRDMEIVSYVLEGGLEHKDSMGNGSVIRPGEVQRMSAGTGITHSEFNNSVTEAMRFFQIWILPEQEGIKPGYEQKYFSEDETHGKLRVIVSPDGRNDSVSIHQDVLIYSARLQADESVRHEFVGQRKAYIQVAKGQVSVNGVTLVDGDGAMIENENSLSFTAVKQAEILLFDLP